MSKTKIAVVQFKAQLKRHLSVAKKYQDAALEVHMLACEDLVHARTHGDVTLCQHLFTTLGGALKGKSYAHTRVEALKAWFVAMSGNQMTADGDTWKMKAGWTAEKFAEEEDMLKSPYWTLTAEKKPDNMSWETILKLLQSLPGRIDRAVTQDKFNGDPEKIKGIITGVVSFAEEKAKRLSAKDLGTLEDKADKVLKAGEKIPHGPIKDVA